MVDTLEVVTLVTVPALLVADATNSESEIAGVWSAWTFAALRSVTELVP
jgi:hypothetical protein